MANPNNISILTRKETGFDLYTDYSDPDVVCFDRKVGSKCGKLNPSPGFVTPFVNTSANNNTERNHFRPTYSQIPNDRKEVDGNAKGFMETAWASSNKNLRNMIASQDTLWSPVSEKQRLQLLVLVQNPNKAVYEICQKAFEKENTFDVNRPDDRKYKFFSHASNRVVGYQGVIFKFMNGMQEFFLELVIRACDSGCETKKSNVEVHADAVLVLNNIKHEGTENDTRVTVKKGDPVNLYSVNITDQTGPDSFVNFVLEMQKNALISGGWKHVLMDSREMRVLANQDKKINLPAGAKTNDHLRPSSWDSISKSLEELNSRFGSSIGTKTEKIHAWLDRYYKNPLRINSDSLTDAEKAAAQLAIGDIGSKDYNARSSRIYDFIQMGKSDFEVISKIRLNPITSSNYCIKLSMQIYIIMFEIFKGIDFWDNGSYAKQSAENFDDYKDNMDSFIGSDIANYKEEIVYFAEGAYATQRGISGLIYTFLLAADYLRNLSEMNYKGAKIAQTINVHGYPVAPGERPFIEFRRF